MFFVTEPEIFSERFWFWFLITKLLVTWLPVALFRRVTQGPTGQVGPCVTRLNNATGNQVTNNFVIKNQNQNRSENISGSVTKNMTHGFSFKGGFNYGVSK